MRVLHLIDGGFRGIGTGADAQWSALACRQLVEHGACQQWVCVLGPRGAVRRVERTGLRVDGAIAPGLGLPELGWRPLRRLMNAWGRPDVIQARGAKAARLALRAVRDSVPRAAVLPEGEPGPADVAITVSRAAKLRIESSGAEIGRAAVVPVPIWPRGNVSREEVRRELGASVDEVLVALLGSSPRADALRFLFLMGLLTEGKTPVRGVVGPDVHGRVRAMEFGRGIRKRWVSTTDRPAMSVLGACDLAVFDGGGPGPTKDWDAAPWSGVPWIVPALNAGVPVVAPEWALGEIGSIAGCAAYNSTLPELARCLMGLADDPERRRAAGEQGRALVSDGFVGAMVETWEGCAAAGAGHG